MRLVVPGSPIGGEDARERGWRARVAAAAAPSALTDVRTLTLAFTLEPDRRVDVDNLARPALAGLRDAGWFSRGFKSLDVLTVTKGTGDAPRLEVCPKAAPTDLDATVDVQLFSTNLLPAEGRHDLKRLWREAVADAWPRAPLKGPLEVQLGFGGRRSLVELLKPNLDALEPILGRDPRGRLEFCPLDDKITRLTAWRISGSFKLMVRVRRDLHPA